MAFWQAKTKEDYPEMETTSLPSMRIDTPATSVVVPTTKPSASVIAMGAIINGPVQSPGDIHIDGLVIGDVQCDTLVVGKNGEVKGNVTSQIATIRGKVSGDVRARMIQLATTGSIDGDLTHAILIIEEGGQFEGRSIRSTDPLANTAIKPAHLEASLKPEPASKSIKSEEQAGSTGDEADYADQPRSSVAEALGDTFSVKA